MPMVLRVNQEGVPSKDIVSLNSVLGGPIYCEVLIYKYLAINSVPPNKKITEITKLIT